MLALITGSDSHSQGVFFSLPIQAGPDGCAFCVTSLYSSVVCTSLARLWACNGKATQEETTKQTFKCFAE